MAGHQFLGWRSLLLPTLLTFYILSWISIVSEASKEEPKLLVLAVATEETDGFKRFMRSARVYGINVEILGMDEEWKGGDVRLYTGGGHKVNFLKEAMKKYWEKEDLIIMFVDSYDVIFMAGPQEILKKFHKTKSKVLFSAEGFCWPDASLADSYPKVEKGKRFLNSGGFMGYAPYINEIITSSALKDEDDDQLFYTKIYLDEDLRKKWTIKLDHRELGIYQKFLNGAKSNIVHITHFAGDVELRFSDTDSYLHNTAYATNPLVVHGNGASKGKQKPHVILAAFVERPTPFLTEFFERLLLLDYPKERMDLFVHLGVEFFFLNTILKI
ncbi:multifunctional procollagen lysine hydroxylase and glycosyltransferase LH3 [Caerostris extrusa]|uniref:Multifunctional procollagen lysine hydroxylase and glycosyltransferase LH3 n=1 Tax=Caerostris extrusa TaxID=172846 RepID=A0AAV4V2S7_CAEEX|nr:multifunctional procollagen lysine hydroxylase and glycosyltransferase LH3 [Caerostris extrusa]